MTCFVFWMLHNMISTPISEIGETAVHGAAAMPGPCGWFQLVRIKLDRSKDLGLLGVTGWVERRRRLIDRYPAKGDRQGK